MDITKITNKRVKPLYKSYDAIQGSNKNFKYNLTPNDRWNFEIALTLLSPYLESNYSLLNERLKTLKIIPTDKSNLEAFSYISDKNALLIDNMTSKNENISLGSAIIDIASEKPNEKSLLSAFYEGEKKAIAQLALTNKSDAIETVYYFDDEIKEVDELASLLNSTDPLLGHLLIRKSLLSNNHDLIYQNLLAKGVNPILIGKYFLASYNHLYNRSDKTYQNLIERKTILKSALDPNYLISKELKEKMQEDIESLEPLQDTFNLMYQKSNNYDRTLRYITEKSIIALKEKENKKQI